MFDTLHRRWPWAVLTAMLLGACEPIPPSGTPFAPVAVEEESAPEVVAEAGTEPVADGSLALPASDPVEAPPPRPEPSSAEPASPSSASPESASSASAGSEAPEPTADPTDTLALQAVLLGKPPPKPAVPSPEAAPQAPASQEPAPPAPPPVWDPEAPLPEATFGVRVLSTLSHLQPPRAVLGLPDGAETVVQAGTILPDEHVIVMAIGRDVVQLARVVPEGYFARIETQNVQALFPTERSDTSR